MTKSLLDHKRSYLNDNIQNTQLSGYWTSKQTRPRPHRNSTITGILVHTIYDKTVVGTHSKISQLVQLATQITNIRPFNCSVSRLKPFWSQYWNRLVNNLQPLTAGAKNTDLILKNLPSQSTAYMQGFDDITDLSANTSHLANEISPNMVNTKWNWCWGFLPLQRRAAATDFSGTRHKATSQCLT